MPTITQNPKHLVDEFEFEFWRGEAPTQLKQEVQQFSRAGVDGHSHRILGERAPSFTCELVSWHVDRDSARDALRDYTALIGGDPVQVTKDGEDLLESESVRFVIIDVVETACKTNVRLVGPGKDYASGVELVTRWTMTPVFAED
jgi:hypothetical protein